MKNDIQTIIDQIDNDLDIDEKKWIACLTQSTLDDRIVVNQKLSDAFYKKNNLEQAKVHAERAWVFSRFEYENAKTYISVLEKLGDIDNIVYVYKQTGMEAARRGNFEEAINLFNSSFYAKALFSGRDFFDYDFDILYKVKEIGESFVIKDKPVELCKSNRKIKLAYLTYGLADAGSVFAKFIHLFAKYHNQEEFEIVFFAPEREEQIYSKDYSLEIVQKIEKFGCRVVCAPNENDRFKRWLDIGKNISEYNPDLFITFAALARFEYYLIASTLPEKIKKVALVYGPPAQYAPMTFDVAIGFPKHPLMDTTIDIYMSSIAPFEVVRDTVSKSPFKKQDFDIPEEATVLISAGRYTKFQSAFFWDLIKKILNTHPNVYFLCVGATSQEITGIDFNIPERVVCLGWRTDLGKILECADIYIDTFPNGGGYTLREAAMKGLPVVSFRHNYFKKFSQDEWMLASEIINVEGILIPVEKSEAFLEVLTKLIVNTTYRKEVANKCFEDIKLKAQASTEEISNYESILRGVV